MLFSIPLVSLFVAEALSCAGHGGKREFQTRSIRTRESATTHDYEYDYSENWGAIKPDYGLCHNGTQQTPIALSGSQGLTSAPLKFNYPNSGVQGTWSTNGFHPRFDLDASKSDSERPSLTFNSETVFLAQFHIHNPAEHTVDGVRSRAELHLVHVDSKGVGRAVVAIRLDVTSHKSHWFDCLPAFIPFRSKATVPASVNFQDLLAESGGFHQYFSYEGSLTSPPCDEGIHWIVNKNTMDISSAQMQELLGASRYSARALQPVWDHFS